LFNMFALAMKIKAGASADPTTFSHCGMVGLA
jgi:hypothetical protein